MNAKLKILQGFEYVGNGGLVLLLVLAWVLTSPLFHLCDWLAGRVKKNENKLNYKGII